MLSLFLSAIGEEKYFCGRELNIALLFLIEVLLKLWCSASCECNYVRWGITDSFILVLFRLEVCQQINWGFSTFVSTVQFTSFRCIVCPISGPHTVWLFYTWYVGIIFLSTSILRASVDLELVSLVMHQKKGFLIKMRKKEELFLSLCGIVLVAGAIRYDFVTHYINKWRWRWLNSRKRHEKILKILQNPVDAQSKSWIQLTFN